MVLSLDGLLSQVAVSDAEVKAWYEAHLSRYQQQEERRASHILITLAAGASDAEKAAKAKAEEVLGDVQRNPDEIRRTRQAAFAGPGFCSQRRRPWLLRPWHDGQALPEEAVFKQKQGELSGLCSPTRLHIIKVTGIKKASEEARRGACRDRG